MPDDVKDQSVVTDYLVSRYYRAPEIILGCMPGQEIDIWSAGVTLFEVYTGNILFDGRNNSEVLKQIVELRGRISQKVVKRGIFQEKYFDPNNQNQMIFVEKNSAVGNLKKCIFNIP